MLLNRNLDSSLLVHNSSHQINKKILVILINKHLPTLSAILHYHHHYPGLDYIVSHLGYCNNLPNDLHVSSLPSSCSLWTHAGRVWPFVAPYTEAFQAACPWDFRGKNTGVGCHFLLWGIFWAQESNLHLLHLQVDSLPLSHLGSSSCSL